MKPGNAFLQRRLGMTALGDDAPEFAVMFGAGSVANADYVHRSPFRRSGVVIAIAAAFLLAFTMPLFTLGGFFDEGDGSLFSLVFTLFTLFWMLGWFTGVALLLLLFLCLVCGRETLSLANGRLSISLGIPGIALAATYKTGPIRNFRYCEDNIPKSRNWRGRHVVFDYGGMEIGFGSDIDREQSRGLIARLREYFPGEGSPSLEIELPSQEIVEPAAADTDKPEQNGQAAQQEREPLHWYSVSGLALIAANLIPLAGVLIAGWDIAEIMLLFWGESAIVGYYNLLKMGKVGGWSLLFYGPFFVGHYGAFMVVHLLFIYALFGSGIDGEADVAALQVFNDMLALWPAFLGLLISHSISYYRNFVVTQAYQGRTMSFQMQEPYRRIIIMHMTLIFGGFITLALGSGVGALMLLLGLKIVADMRAHLAQHSG